jgi:hypothetical protein
MAARFLHVRSCTKFSLRTLFVAVTVCAIWLGVKTNQARKQQEAVAALTELGVQIGYDWNYNEQNPLQLLPNAIPPGPEWLRNLIGEHYYSHFHDTRFFEMARADTELHAETLRNPELRRTAAQTLALMRDTFTSMIEKVPPPGNEGRGSAKSVANLVIALWFGLQYTKAVDPDSVDTDEVFALLQYLLTLPDATAA